MEQINYKDAYENVMIANKMLEQENQRLQNIIKEAREYAGDLRLYDNESIEFEISTKLFDILDKEIKK